MSEYKITNEEAHKSLNDIVDFYIEDDYDGLTTMSVERLREYIKQQEEHDRDVQKFIELVLVFLGIDDKYVSFGNNVELNKKWKQLKELKTKLKGDSNS